MLHIENLYTYPELPPHFDNVVLPVDKEKGWTSFDVVKKVRGILRGKKVGHAGTLDPMATGLLICLIGKATKQMEAYMGQTKQYTGTIRLGETTPSYDAETEVTERVNITHLEENDIYEAATTFLGTIQQTPPMYSALKVGGERLYKKARRGEYIERKKREVTIYSFEIESVRQADVRFSISCSKGTYIRSIAHDLGQLLNVGGHLVQLRRTAIGKTTVDKAWSIDALEEAVSARTRKAE